MWALAVTWTLKTANESFCMTLWPIMMHHNTTFENKMFGGPEHTIWTTWTFWPFAVTLTLNAVVKFFLQDTLAYDDVSSDQVWLPRNQHLKKYGRKNHILITWALSVTLTLKIATKTTATKKTKQNICTILWLMMVHHRTTFGNKMFCDSENIIQTNIHWHCEPSMWPWPWMQ